MPTCVSDASITASASRSVILRERSGAPGRGGGSTGGSRAAAATAARAAGELRGIAVAHARGVEADAREQLVDARADARGRPAEKLRHRRDVLADRPVREEADLLDDVPDPSTELRRILS